MKVLFLGQLGLLATRGHVPSSREQRIAQLGRALTLAGHRVTVLGTKPYLDPTITNYHGITLRPKLSLDPQNPGGWLYLLSSLVTLWRLQPQIVHMHSWRAGALAWLAALLSPETVIIWTIDTLPHRFAFIAHLIAAQAKRTCNVITVPTRTLQYRLLTQFHLPTYYIPDGYTPPKLKDIPPKFFGLRKNQYCVLLAHAPDSIRQAIRACMATKSRKQLVIIEDPAAAWQRLINKKSFVYFVGAKHGRQLTSLIRNAAGVIMASDYANLEALLVAMDSGQRIVAANTTLCQETLGVAGWYFRPGKIAELREALQQALQNNTRGSQAKKRAKNHFLWERITREYLALYRYHELRYVPVDSARQFAHERVRAGA